MRFRRPVRSRLLAAAALAVAAGLCPALAVVAAPSPALAQAPAASARPADAAPPELLQWQAAHSSVQFTSRFMRVVRVPGRFHRVQATIAYDTADPTRSAVAAVIETASLDTDNDPRDHHLKSPDFFDVDKYPTIVFRSRSVERQDDGFVAKGPLTIHGVTRDVSIPFVQLMPRTVGSGGNVSMAWVGQVTLDRNDFGVVGGNRFNPGFNLAAVALGDSIDITLNVFARRISVRNFPYSSGPKPSIGAVLDSVVARDGVAAAVRRYHEIADAHAADYDMGETQLVLLGYRLMERGRAADAVEVMKLVTAAHPESANAFDSLGEAQLAAGRTEAAAASYRKELELQPNSTAAMAALGWLGG